MREPVAMLDMSVDGQEVRLHCRRPDGVWVTVKALTYRQAMDRVPPGWMFIGAAICDAHASDGWWHREQGG